MLKSILALTTLCVYSEAQPEEIPWNADLDIEDIDETEATIQKLLEATVVMGDPNEVLDLPYRLG
jgi:soluble P-type ATPase